MLKLHKKISRMRNVKYHEDRGKSMVNGQKVENAFDGNMETFVSAFSVGIDLGKPFSVKQIRFAPRNDNNGIVVGDRYELWYYDREWISAGVKQQNIIT